MAQSAAVDHPQFGTQPSVNDIRYSPGTRS